jgi:hypothetical protein
MQQLFQGRQKMRQWSTKFMTDIREELDLGAIQICQAFQTLSLALFGGRLRSGGTDLPRDEIDEVAIVSG